MAQDTSQIVVGADGEIHTAALSSTQPTTASGTFDSAWTDLGYVTEDGVTMRDSKEHVDLNVWQEFYPARQIVTSKNFEVVFTLRQWNTQTLSIGLGGGTVTEPTPGTFKFVPPDPQSLDERMLAVTWRDGTKTYRLIVPKGRTVETVESQLIRTDSANIPITFQILGTTGVDPFYILTNDTAFDPTP
jgi:hypothetical protein